MKQLRKLKEQIQTEIDTSYLYAQIAKVQNNDGVRHVLQSLAEVEQGHAHRILAHARTLYPKLELPKPSLRAKIRLKAGKIFGYSQLLQQLTVLEKNIAQGVVENKRRAGIAPSGFEGNHVDILEALSANQELNVWGQPKAKLEKHHRSIGGNALRAAVLGANDGLVSNMSLIMGIAGAAVSNGTIVITGLSGLLAGAIAMALGEWISVQSARELSQKQIELELAELEASPEEEKEELILLYQAKGMDADAARQLADNAFKDKATAAHTMVTEELGIDPDDLGGSAWEASLASFCLFAAGAIIPLFPFFFLSGHVAVYASLGASTVGLFVIGGAITIFTGRPLWFSGLRQVVFGLVAACITYAIGHFIGVSIVG